MVKYGVDSKYYEARQRAVEKYQAKTYRKINVALRLDEDADIIESMDYARDNGIPLRQWLSDIFHYGGSPKEIVPEGYVSKSDVWKLLRDMGVSDEIIRKVMEL